MIINPLTAIDFYKADHRRQYPPGTNMVFSNFTPRSVKHLIDMPGTDKKIVHFGLQYFMRWFMIDMFNQYFFAEDRDKVVAKYKRRLDNALGPDAVPVDHIGELHELGYLPLSIWSLPEGSVVDARTPTFCIYSTKDCGFWLVNYLESVLSCMNWQSATSATIARRYKQLLLKYAVLTGGDVNFIPFQGHDFSFRGMGSLQTAVMSGAGHLLSFVGTDTVPAIDFLEDYYGADSDSELVGCSVPATEHSVMCMGTMEDELGTFRRLITELYPKGIVSIVSDTWDFWKVLSIFLPQLRRDIMARDGKVVIRPDSGDPYLIICGDKGAPKDSFQHLGAVQLLWDVFGGTTNQQGFRVLDPHIGLIYGDSITLALADRIMAGLAANRFASTNVVFGVGSFTYQYVTRDTLGWAMKATAGEVNGEFREIFKDPATDDGMKKSAKGYIAVHEGPNGTFTMKDQATKEEFQNCAYREVFRDGKILIEQNLADIRARVDASIQVPVESATT